MRTVDIAAAACLLAAACAGSGGLEASSPVAICTPIADSQQYGYLKPNEEKFIERVSGVKGADTQQILSGYVECNHSVTAIDVQRGVAVLVDAAAAPASSESSNAANWIAGRHLCVAMGLPLLNSPNTRPEPNTKVYVVCP